MFQLLHGRPDGKSYNHNQNNGYKNRSYSHELYLLIDILYCVPPPPKQGAGGSEIAYCALAAAVFASFSLSD